MNTTPDIGAFKVIGPRCALYFAELMDEDDEQFVRGKMGRDDVYAVEALKYCREILSPLLSAKQDVGPFELVFEGTPRGVVEKLNQ